MISNLAMVLLSEAAIEDRHVDEITVAVVFSCKGKISLSQFLECVENWFPLQFLQICK
jgi:hypothetical protein